MNILITMAGESRRFKDAGITTPKYKLRIDDTSMFSYAMASLSDFYDEHFVFITRDSHDVREFLKTECTELGIGSFDVVTVSGLTSGQASTALVADDYVKDTDPIAIYNIDTYVEEGELAKSEVKGDGHIPVFEPPGDHWSFVRTDDHGHVTAVAEKERISSLATVGFYYFDEWCKFTEAYDALADEVESEYGETYVAPLYEWFIREGLKITVQHLPAESVHVIGTPKEVVEFHPPIAERYGL